MSISLQLKELEAQTFFYKPVFTTIAWTRSPKRS